MEGISVVIPTRDRPRFLAAAIASVASQTMPPQEVIVVFDQTSVEPIRGCGIPAFRTVATGRHAGVSAARNLGAQVAQYRWLAFLDDDDWWLPEYLKCASAAASTAGATMVGTSFLAAVGGSLLPEKEAPETIAQADFFAKNPGIRGSNLFVLRDLYCEIGGCDEQLPALNDLDLVLRLRELAGLRYTRVTKPLVVVRKHSGPRLTGRGSVVVREAVKRFLERHRGRMTPADLTAFFDRIKRYWNVERVPE